MVDGEATLYLERGGRTALAFTDDAELLRASATALADALRRARAERLRVETVNGGIKLDEQAGVGGNAETVNGAISLIAAEVGGKIITTNGDITLARGATVRGGILVEKPQGNWWNNSNNRKPRVVIGANSQVHGPLVFEREVELFVHSTAKIGQVTGATAQPFTDTLPPRED